MMRCAETHFIVTPAKAGADLLTVPLDAAAGDGSPLSRG